MLKDVYDTSLLLWDRHSEIDKNIRRSLKRIGIYMYSLPLCRGSDTYGFILSKKMLTYKEVRKIDKESRPWNQEHD